MNILIVNCHWGNRGDESAIRAMVDELLVELPDAKIYIQSAIGSFDSFPKMDRVEVIPTFPGKRKRKLITDVLAVYSNGIISLSKESRFFFNILKKIDIVIHAPGGPSIGDLYLPQEKYKLWRLSVVRKHHIPYVFYAPSMGPFKNKKRNKTRKKILKGADLICLRESISDNMLKEFIPGIKTHVTLDSAFQHEIDKTKYEAIYKNDKHLMDFFASGKEIIGITITDLMWNSKYNTDTKTAHKIKEVFSLFIDFLITNGYSVLFIPQLFGGVGDRNYMNTFAIDGCYVLDDHYDCYFQQYIISKVKAVVGMRYHSNIFSAKMGTPFISVSYEQKMLGFMKKAKLLDYCIDINNLSFDSLKEKFSFLIKNYDDAREQLQIKRRDFINESHRTTELVVDLIKKMH